MNRLIYSTFFLLLSSCFSKAEIKVDGTENLPALEQKSLTELVTSITSVKIKDDELTIDGTDLDQVDNIKVITETSEEMFQIKSKSESKIIATSIKNTTLALDEVLSLMMTSAEGAEASFEINFSIKDGSINAKHLSSMSAQDGEVLTYNGTTKLWEPKSLSGLTYRGLWDAANLDGLEPSDSPQAGDYWVISNSGSIVLSNVTAWETGDWAIFNGENWEKIKNNSDVTSFNGRLGAIIPEANDYTWAQIDKTLSTIDDISDVDTSTLAPSTGETLKWDGSNWVPAADEVGPSGTVTAVSGSAPIGVTNSTTTPSITITQATTSTDGYLSSTDWNTFNSKQGAITTGSATEYLKADLTKGTFANDVAATVLSNFSTGTDSSVANTDSIEAAIEKLQGQVDNRLSSESDPKIGTLTTGKWCSSSDGSTIDCTENTPTTDPTTTMTGLIQSTAAGDSYFTGGNVGIGHSLPTADLHIKSSGPQLLIENTTSGTNDSTLRLSSGEDIMLSTGALGSGLVASGFITFNTSSDMDPSNPSNPRMFLSAAGNLGIGTGMSEPAATLEVNGFMKLAKNTGEPATCDATKDGSVALTSTYRLCVCNSTGWVFSSDGTTACAWQ